MRRLILTLALLLLIGGCAGKDFWVQGPGTVTITTPIGSVSITLEDGAIYSSSPTKQPEQEDETEPE